ncbi:variable large family protein [Borrelia duttonii]
MKYKKGLAENDKQILSSKARSSKPLSINQRVAQELAEVKAKNQILREAIRLNEIDSLSKKYLNSHFNKEVMVKFVIMMMMVMGCNSGGVKEVEEVGLQEVGGLKLGDTTKSIFSAFVDLITNSLGISVTNSTKKSDISDKFKDLVNAIDKAINQVQEVASKVGINVEESQDGSIGQAKKTLNELKKHITSLQTLINESMVVSGVTANVATAVEGVGSSVEDVKGALKALKGIVNFSVKKSTVSKNETVSNEEKEGGKVLKTTGGGGAVEGDAAKALSIVTSVTGEDMLYAITSAEDSDVVAETTISSATQPKHAVKLAVTGAATTADNAQNASKLALAGGIALRSLLKGGKLDASAAKTSTNAVNGVGVSAVNKLLKAIESITKIIVSQCLEQTEQILLKSNRKAFNYI